MIRPLLVVTKSKSSYEKEKDFKSRLEQIAEDFVRYLDTYRSDKGRDSKHGKMGPVGKVLSRMRSGKVGKEVLGEAVRIHEMTSARYKDNKQSKLSPEGLKALEKAVHSLTDILGNTSLSERNRIIAAVDAIVYYLLERNRVTRLQAWHERFRNHVKGKYGDLEALRKAWGDPLLTWDEIPFPYKSTTNANVKVDVDEFYGTSSADKETEEEMEV